MVNHSLFLKLTLKALENKIPIIDVRPVTDFVAGHLPFSTSITLSDLEQSWHELPPKKSPLQIMANLDQVDNLAEIFEQQDYPIEKIMTPELITDANSQTGNHSQRLWKANPLLEKHIELIKNHISVNQPLVFDIGSGSGRDSIFLSLHGFKALAIDNNQHALKRLAKFSKRSAADIKSHDLNMQTQSGELQQLIEQQQPQLIVQARYLHRPLLDLYKNSLASGAMVAIHTFTQEAAKFGKPKNPAYLLQDDELLDKFSGWNILLNQEHRLDDGRPLSIFLARKP